MNIRDIILIFLFCPIMTYNILYSKVGEKNVRYEINKAINKIEKKIKEIRPLSYILLGNYSIPSDRLKIYNKLEEKVNRLNEKKEELAFIIDRFNRNLQRNIDIDSLILFNTLNLSDMNLNSLDNLFVFLIDINGIIPIETLILSYNELKEIPNEIFNLKYIKELNLEANKLVGLPKEISKLSNLKVLLLDKNPTRIILPKTLNRSDLFINGMYAFVGKNQANIVILLDRDNQDINKKKEAIQMSIDLLIEQHIPMLISGRCLENYLERDKEIGPMYEIYKVENSDLYLIIPYNIKFKNAFNIKQNNRKNIKELKLLLKNEIWPNHNGSYKSDNWINGIKSIFKIETNDKENVNYWWNIVLIGHGSTMDPSYAEMTEEIFGEEFLALTIAGLSNNHFKEFISFLNYSGINVFFFYYDTCFGGGTNLIKPYIERTENISNIKLSKFIIVSGATRGSTSHFVEMDFNDLFKRLGELLNFSELTKENKKKLGLDPVSGLLNIIKNNISKDRLSRNFPLIKFPNSKFFISVRKDTIIKVINNVLLKKHILEKKGIVVSKKTNFVFVYPNIIEPNIIIEGKQSPIFISLDPGPAIHFFTKIEAKEINESNILNLFIEKKIDEEMKKEGHKMFIIKEFLLGKNIDDTIDTKSEKSKYIKYVNVVINIQTKEMFYQKENSFYKKDDIGIYVKNKYEFQQEVLDLMEIVYKEKKYEMKSFGSKIIAPWQTNIIELIDYVQKKLKINSNKIRHFISKSNN